jgi:hypothetical protein
MLFHLNTRGRVPYASPTTGDGPLILVVCPTPVTNKNIGYSNGMYLRSCVRVPQNTPTVRGPRSSQPTSWVCTSIPRGCFHKFINDSRCSSLNNSTKLPSPIEKVHDAFALKMLHTDTPSHTFFLGCIHLGVSQT